MRGLVTINKIYKDGRVENVIKDEENTLTQGFSLAMTRMLTKGQESDADDFKFEYFQLGTSSYYSGFMWDESLANATRRNFFKLRSPILTLDEYGKSSDMEIVLKNTIVAEEQFVESKDLVYTKENQYLAKIGPGRVSMLNYNPVTQADALSEVDGLGQVRRTQNSLLIRLLVDEEAANGLDLQEFGLFIKDPEEILGEDQPVLAAYKSLSEPIRKTNDFFLDVQWVIELFDIVNNYTALTDCIFFKPAYLQRAGTTQRGTFVKDVKAGEYYDIELDSPVPTLTGGKLYYTIFNEGDEGDDDEFTYAKRNVHYNILNDEGYGTPTVNSPMEWEPQSSRKVLKFFAYPNPNYFKPRIVRIRLDSFDGDKEVPTRRSQNYPRDFIIRINPSVAASQEILFDGGVTGSENNFKKCVIKTEDGSPFYDDLDIILNVDAAASYDLRIDNGSIQNFTESRKHKIRVEKNAPRVDVFLRSTSDLTVSLENREGAVYNYADFSNNFEAGLAGSALTTVKVEDVINHVDDLSTVNSKWFVDNFLGSKEWFDGFPTRKVHQGYGAYPQIPSPDIFVDTFRVPGDIGLTPDKLETAQFSYCHPFLYTWPDSEGNIFAKNGGRITLGKTHRTTDAVGNSTGGRNNDDRYRPQANEKTSVFSVFVKKIDSVVDPTKSVLDESGNTYTCSSSEFFSMEETTQGFPDIQTEFDNTGKKVVFRWEPNGGLVAHKCYTTLGTNGSLTFNNDFARRISYTAAGSFQTYATQSDIGRQLVATRNDGTGQLDLGILTGDEIIDDGTDTAQIKGYLHFRSDSLLSNFNNVLNEDQTVRVLRVRNANGQGLDENGLKLFIGVPKEVQISEGPFGFIDGAGLVDSDSQPFYAIDCGVFSGTNGGSASRDEDKYGKTDALCKDGWYRAWVACDIPPKLSQGSTESELSDGKGAFHNRAIYPSVGGAESHHKNNGLVVFPGDIRNGLVPNLGSWRQVPNTELSSTSGFDMNRTYFSSVDGYESLYTQPFLSSIPGTMMAYEQYERYNTNDTMASYVPRDYQPRPGAFFGPYGGLRNSNLAGAVKELTFNFS